MTLGCCAKLAIKVRKKIDEERILTSQTEYKGQSSDAIIASGSAVILFSPMHHRSLRTKEAAWLYSY